MMKLFSTRSSIEAGRAYLSEYVRNTYLNWWDSEEAAVIHTFPF